MSASASNETAGRSDPRRSGKRGFVFSVEAVFSLLAACALVLAVSGHTGSSGAHAGADPLLRVHEFQVLNGFLEVRAHSLLTDDYVAYSGFCLKIESARGTEFLPESCAGSASREAVATERMEYREGGFSILKASIWKP